MSNNRWPTVGDLLVEKSNGETHQGLVTRIEGGPGFGTSRVYIKWANKIPYSYRQDYGYSAVNIHNDFSSFELVKA